MSNIHNMRRCNSGRLAPRNRKSFNPLTQLPFPRYPANSFGEQFPGTVKIGTNPPATPSLHKSYRTHNPGTKPEYVNLAQHPRPDKHSDEPHLRPTRSHKPLKPNTYPQ